MATTDSRRVQGLLDAGASADEIGDALVALGFTAAPDNRTPRTAQEIHQHMIDDPDGLDAWDQDPNMPHCSWPTSRVA